MEKIWILTAMSQEAEYIIQLLDLKKTRSFSNIVFFENERVVLVLTGIGKIQASIGTTLLCTLYPIKKLINIGIAGSLLGNEACIGDVFFVDKLIQHDMYLPFDWDHLNYAKGMILLQKNPNIKREDRNFMIHYGALCLTGDQFIDDQKRVKTLRDETWAELVEMEAFAVASVAREFGLLSQTIVIKAISDGADAHAREVHEDNLDLAMKNSLIILQEIL